jgi:hypothetical protein
VGRELFADRIDENAALQLKSIIWLLRDLHYGSINAFYVHTNSRELKKAGKAIFIQNDASMLLSDLPQQVPPYLLVESELDALTAQHTAQATVA